MTDFFKITVAIFVMPALTNMCACQDHNASYYENSAKHWLDNMKYQYAGVSCSARDSDNDGYVTCSVNMAPGSPMQVLLCDGNGCKPSKDFVPPVPPPAPVPSAR